MAVGDRSAKKLSQSALTSSLAAQVTGAVSKRTQITKLWITNTNTTTTRYVQLAAFGTATANQLANNIELAAKATILIENAVVLEAGEILYAKQDTGTDVVITTFGIEEAV
jgi:capsid protein